MFAIIYSTILLFAEAGNESGWERFRHLFSEYFSIPGFEIWKFVNLGIFIAIIVYLARKPLSEQFRAKRDAIRADLIRAEEEKKAALERLTSIEARLAQLESEKESILARAKEESEAERRRLSEQTNAEIKRLREQADAEVTRLANQARAELRRYSAEESIRLAEQKLRSAIGPAENARLVKAGISEIGGLN
jgi:F0F1-type ATP synthase membrane subunit b/b'